MKATLDSWIGRLLWVTPQQQTLPAETIEKTEHVFQYSILYSAMRCILQYVILPFVLPVIGLATDVATQISLVISLVAVVAIFTTLRRFWKIDYAYKWQYLGVATVALTLLAAFIFLDIQSLFL